MCLTLCINSQLGKLSLRCSKKFEALHYCAKTSSPLFPSPIHTNRNETPTSCTFNDQINSDLPSSPTSPKRSAHFTFTDKKMYVYLKYPSCALKNIVDSITQSIFMDAYWESGERGWARSGPVCWGTALQAGRSRVWFQMLSLKFFFDIFLPAALWPWGLLSL